MCTNKEKLLHDALRITNLKNQKSSINSSERLLVPSTKRNTRKRDEICSKLTIKTL